MNRHASTLGYGSPVNRKAHEATWQCWAWHGAGVKKGACAVRRKHYVNKQAPVTVWQHWNPDPVGTDTPVPPHVVTGPWHVCKGACPNCHMAVLGHGGMQRGMPMPPCSCTGTCVHKCSQAATGWTLTQYAYEQAHLGCHLVGWKYDILQASKHVPPLVLPTNT